MASFYSEHILFDRWRTDKTSALDVLSCGVTVWCGTGEDATNDQPSTCAVFCIFFILFSL